MPEALEMLARWVVTAFGVFLIALGCLALARPRTFRAFLSGFAQSARVHALEMGLRLVRGTVGTAAARAGPQKANGTHHDHPAARMRLRVRRRFKPHAPPPDTTWDPKQQPIEEPGQPATAAAISRADAKTNVHHPPVREPAPPKHLWEEPALQSGATIRTLPRKAERSRSDMKYHFNNEAGIGYGLRFEG